MTFRYDIPDYEHLGDLKYAKHELNKICKVTNLKGFEERDYEAESDYENDYGELDEPIYIGYVTFNASDEHKQTLIDFGCYEY